MVLKVLGARRAMIARLFLLEYGALGLVTALVAVPVGTLAASFVTTSVMHLPFRVMPGAIGQTVGLALTITLIAGLAGTWRALGRPAAGVLRNE